MMLWVWVLLGWFCRCLEWVLIDGNFVGLLFMRKFYYVGFRVGWVLGCMIRGFRLCRFLLVGCRVLFVFFCV